MENKKTNKRILQVVFSMVIVVASIFCFSISSFATSLYDPSSTIKPSYIQTPIDYIEFIKSDGNIRYNSLSNTVFADWSVDATTISKTSVGTSISNSNLGNSLIVTDQTKNINQNYVRNQSRLILSKSGLSPDVASQIINYSNDNADKDIKSLEIDFGEFFYKKGLDSVSTSPSITLYFKGESINDNMPQILAVYNLTKTFKNSSQEYTAGYYNNIYKSFGCTPTYVGDQLYWVYDIIFFTGEFESLTDSLYIDFNIKVNFASLSSKLHNIVLTTHHTQTESLPGRINSFVRNAIDALNSYKSSNSKLKTELETQKNTYETELETQKNTYETELEIQQKQYEELENKYNSAKEGLDNTNAITKLFDGIYGAIHDTLGIFFDMDFFGFNLGSVIAILLVAVVVIVILKFVL